jgi:hypothetical protein
MARGYKEPPQVDNSRLEDQARRNVRRKATELEDVAHALRGLVSPSPDSRNTADFLERVVQEMRRMAGEWKGGPV